MPGCYRLIVTPDGFPFDLAASMIGSPVLPARQRVLVFGASGTIGRASVKALVEDGHQVTCFVRPSSATVPLDVPVRRGELTDPESVMRDAFGGDQFDVVVSCLASRTGVPEDAWRVDFECNRCVLEAAKAAGAGHFILLSAICVQKPVLAFQHAKLAFERMLMDSGLRWSIVRPTAFFKSLSGQIERVRRGKPYLLFGNGELTRCKPISDQDLGRYISGCIADPQRHDRILPIGGPGPAISPREQGEALFEIFGKTPRFRHVPLGFLDVVIGLLSAAGKISRRAAEKAEYARIGRYYATESMLVLDPESGLYRADLTPETGNETLFSHYAAVAGLAPPQ